MTKIYSFVPLELLYLKKAKFRSLDNRELSYRGNDPKKSKKRQDFD